MGNSIFEIPLMEFHYDTNMSLPTHGIMSITNRCNLACPYCFHTQSNQDMSLETAEMAARYLLSNAAQSKKKPSISFFGGEPLLRFDDIIRPLVKKYRDSFGWSITTNGNLLNQTTIDFCVKHNIKILLSIDGCKEVQEYQRPRQDGHSSFSNLKNIIPYLLLKMPNTVFRATLTKFSLDYLDKTIKMAESFGFKYITFVPNLFEDWDPEDFYKWENFIDKEAIKLMQWLSWEEPVPYILTNLSEGVKTIHRLENIKFLNSPLISCGMGTNGIGISVDGSLHPCQEENGLNTVKSIGDIYKGIDTNLHLEYCQDIYNKWEEYLEKIDNIPGSPNFKLFYANSFCNTRLKDGFSVKDTQTYFLRAVHRAASRLYYQYHLTLNPEAQRIFQV